MDEHSDVLQRLYPCMARFVDEIGGICPVDCLAIDPETKYLHEMLPDEERFKLRNILSLEPQFFTLLEDRDAVATALGYENDYIRLEDGNILPKGDERLEELMKEHNEYIANRPEIPTEETENNSTIPSEILALRENIIDAILNMNDRDLEATCRGVCQKRRGIYGDTAPDPLEENTNDYLIGIKEPPPPPTRPKRRTSKGSVNDCRIYTDQHLKMLESMMRISAKILETTPQLDAPVRRLEQDMLISPLKGALQDSQFLRLFVDCYPSYFSVYNDGNNVTHVVLTHYPPEGNAPPENTPQRDNLYMFFAPDPGNERMTITTLK